MWSVRGRTIIARAIQYPEERKCMQIAQQAMNENDQKIFENFRQREGEVCVASLARWNAQFKDLVVLERRCRNTTQEVQKRATEKYHDQSFFEEMEELEEK